MEDTIFGYNDEYKFNDNELTYYYPEGSTPERMKKSWTILKEDVINGKRTDSHITIKSKYGDHQVPTSVLNKGLIDNLLQWVSDNEHNNIQPVDLKVLFPEEPSVSGYKPIKHVGRYEINFKSLHRNTTFDFGANQDTWTIYRNNVVDYKVDKNIGDGSKGHIVPKAIVGGALFGGLGSIAGAAHGVSKTAKLNDLTITVFSKTGKTYHINALADFSFSHSMKSVKTSSIEYESIMKNTKQITDWLDQAISDNK